IIITGNHYGNWFLNFYVVEEQENVVGRGGFEPPTPGSSVRRKEQIETYEPSKAEKESEPLLKNVFSKTLKLKKAKPQLINYHWSKYKNECKKQIT
ncbi:MAG: hypothetical protein H5T85_07415, partial [Actinobacteria bacterium]|nr:hypothetical protein [Actinomycetota bacterium]